MEAVSEEKIKAFLDFGSGYGYGSGSGSGYGYGYGDGSGSGSGSGYGSGSGDGSGSGSDSGSGSGSGSGYGDGSGSGYGSGSGSGSGYGYGYGDGITELNGLSVHLVDEVQTVFYHIRGNVAKGAILRDNLTLEPCFIVKGHGHFAHGKNLHEAMQALTNKAFDDMSEDERIAEFVKAHPEYRKPYSNRDLYDWHHRLTGSCEMGRNEFVASKGIDLDGESTIEEFVAMTRNSYGSATIRKLPEAYGIK